MGYRSDIVIGVKKEVLVRNLLEKEIPDALGQPDTITGDAAYWFISGWKWYTSYPEVQEIETWFENLLMDEFGALRIGENDDDTETWGSPYDFEIYLNRSIAYPGNS